MVWLFKVGFLNLVIVSLCCGLYYRGKVDTSPKGKIRADLFGVELSDYRFGLGDPYVIFYEKDNYRGNVHFQLLGRTCKNLPDERQNWASSVDVQKRCITVCDQLDCKGTCTKIYDHPEDPNNKGASKLTAYEMNDKIKSVKYCFL